MTRKILYISLFLGLGFPAIAQDGAKTESEAKSPEAVEISQEECGMLARQALRQSADYVPGLSASGKAVTGANTESASTDYLPDTYTIPLTASLEGLLGLSDNQKAFLGEGLSIGRITVSRGGTVKLNGRRIGGPSDSVELWQALCQQ